MSGTKSYLAGLSAEAAVQRCYERLGFEPCAKRWRGSRGEVDLIFSKDDGYVFVEVKKNKTHAAAADALTSNQQQRIMNTALEFIADRVGHLDVDMRFDLATLCETGEIDLRKGALMAH